MSDSDNTPISAAPTLLAMVIACGVSAALFAHLWFDLVSRYDRIVSIWDGGALILAMSGAMSFAALCRPVFQRSATGWWMTRVTVLLFGLLGIVLCFWVLVDSYAALFTLLLDGSNAHSRQVYAFQIVVSMLIAAGGSLWAAILGVISAYRLGRRASWTDMPLDLTA